MSLWRKRKPSNEAGLQEARQAIVAANLSHDRAEARWPLIHAVTRSATRTGRATSQQIDTNHLGDTFAAAMREGRAHP